MAGRTNGYGANTVNIINADEMYGVHGRMANAKQQQVEALWVGVIEMLDHVVVMRDRRLGRISDWRHLHLSTLLGTTRVLEVVERLVEMENLLRAARVPDMDKIDILKIQLIDITKIQGNRRTC